MLSWYEDRPYLKALCKNLHQITPPAPSAKPRHILRPKIQPRPDAMLPPSPPPSPSPNGKISNGKDERSKYVYIDHSNFWISRKIATGDKNWRYDVKSFTSLLTSNSLSTETTGSHNAQVHIYGYIPDDLKELWTNEHAKVHKLKKPHPLDTKEEVGDEKKETKNKRKKNIEKEVDTRLVADSVAEAARALHQKLKDTHIEFVIVSGDRDMRPAVKKIINYGYKVRVWSWKRALSMAYRDLEKKRAGRLEVHLLDDYKDKFVTTSKLGMKDQAAPS